MSHSAVSQRVICNVGLGLALLCLASCSQVSSDPVGSGSSSVDADGAVADISSTDYVDKLAGINSEATNNSNTGWESPALDSVESDSTASSRVLLSADRTNFGLELVDGTSFNQLVLLPPVGSSNSADSSYEVTRLDSPDRLVVDLFGYKEASNRNFDTRDSEFVSRVRIGSHPDKTRVVLDLVPSRKINYDVTQSLAGSYAATKNEGKGVVITLSDAAVKNAGIKNAGMKKVSEQVASRNTYSDLQSAAAPTTLGANKPSVTTAAVSSVAIEPVSSSQNMIVAHLSSPNEFAPNNFSLKQTAPSEYVLKLDNSNLNPDVAASILAPPGTGAIRSVRSTKSGSDVVLRIFASPTAELNAKADGGKIVVSARDTANADDYRAQAAPEVVSDAAASPTEAAADSTAAAAPATNGDFDSEISALLDEAPKYTGRLISLDLQDTDIDNALRIIAEVSNLNIIASEDVTGKVTLRLIDVPWDQALDVILKTNGLDKVQEGNVVRIAPVEKLRSEREALKQAQQAEEDLEPLQVRYVRVSYAKASELKTLVESVLSERGAVAYDERTNQLIIKDIKKGIKNVAELVAKIDLRTPQVLLETQIVEANRNLLRDLGSEFGFNYVRSPSTGNATGYNFPNAITASGSVTGSDGSLASFPAAESATAGSAISLLLDSADATKSLSVRLSALENQGRVRIVSRPAVATTNNKQAIIKSVERIRIKTPAGGTSVAVGSGGNAGGSAAVATEQVEIGIVLEVTPQASPDYFVLLDINAKSSTLGSTLVDGIPSEIERSATSTVLVSSGQTFAMGGIYKISDSDRVSGIPFFKDIPFIGHLFRRTLVDNSDEELLFFLTPRIIEGSFDDAAMRVNS